MRRSSVLLAIGALALGACSAAGSGSYSGAVVDGGIAAAVRGAAQASASTPVTSVAPESQAAGSPAASVAPGASGALIPGVSLTIEPSDGSVFGLPPTVPAGTNLLLFNVADVPYQMTVLEKNPSVTDSWDVILACGVTSSVATVVGSVIAQPGGGADAGVTVTNEGEDLLALIPLAAPAESAAPSAAPTEAPSVAPSVVPSEAPSAAASEAAGSPAPSVAPEPTATPAPTCPPGGIAGASSAPSESAAVPSIAASPSAAASQAAASTKPHKTHKPGKPGKSPKPTVTPAPTPIAGIPDLTNAAWQLFTVTPAGTLPGQTPAP